MVSKILESIVQVATWLGSQPLVKTVERRRAVEGVPAMKNLVADPVSGAKGCCRCAGHALTRPARLLRESYHRRCRFRSTRTRARSVRRGPASRAGSSKTPPQPPRAWSDFGK